MLGMSSWVKKTNKKKTTTALKGSSSSPFTGIFTAAAKGVYVLRLSAQDVGTVAAGAPSDTGTKALTLMLEEGEQVHVGLRSQSAARFHFHAHIHIHLHVHIHVKKLW